MPIKLLNRLNLIFLSLSALFLPWQTKLILSPAPSNYWEISFFLANLPVLGFILTCPLVRNLSLKDLKKNLLHRNILILALLLISALASVLNSSYFLLSAFRFQLLAVSIIFSVYLYHSPSKDKKIFISFLFISLFFQSLLGLSLFFAQSSLSSKYLGIAYHLASDLGTAVIETPLGRWLRAYGASDHPNIFGGLMALASLGIIIAYQGNKEKKFNFVFLSLFIFFLSALLSSFSRSAFLAFGIGFLWISLEQAWWQKIKRKKSIHIVILLLIISSFFFVQYKELFLARLDTGNRLELISIREREEQNKEAWHQFLKQPFAGVGLGNFAHDKYLDSTNKIDIWRFQPTHNYWLLSLNEVGMFFTLALFFIFILAYKKSRPRKISGLLIALIVLSLFDHWLLSLPLAPLWTFTLLALIW